MPKYRKLTHCIYSCSYHIVWTPKYRFRILEGKVKEIIESRISQVCEWYDVEIDEMSIMPDHVHIVCSIPPKKSVSKFMGILKGKTAVQIFAKKCSLKEKPYWGNHFWARGYFVSTVGIDGDLIKRYVRYQEKEERQKEQDGTDYKLF
ncbi:IS200/IS605 family transposase [Saccharicrinis sp. FJH2]|uniref:IS200/IS605 family transposase n=1 Tax=Saccharicrinis sp. FJH65 TaxID=3344659 RepID=UPI0035F25906